MSKTIFFMIRLLILIRVLFLFIMYDIDKKINLSYDSILRIFTTYHSVNDINNQPYPLFLKDFAKQERNRMK